MPEIEWNLPKEFRLAFSDAVRGWDFRQGPELHIQLPPDLTSPPVRADDRIELHSVALKAEMVIRREAGSLPRRVFVVSPKGPGDKKLIEDWVERLLTSRRWMMEGLL